MLKKTMNLFSYYTSWLSHDADIRVSSNYERKIPWKQLHVHHCSKRVKTISCNSSSCQHVPATIQGTLATHEVATTRSKITELHGSLLLHNVRFSITWFHDFNNDFEILFCKKNATSAFLNKKGKYLFKMAVYI